jgi:hypothetical protein
VYSVFKDIGWTGRETLDFTKSSSLLDGSKVLKLYDSVTIPGQEKTLDFKLDSKGGSNQ